MSTDYSQALEALYPDALWGMNNNDYATLEWTGPPATKPTKKKLDDAWPQVKYQQEHDRIEAERRARYQTETDGIFFEAQRDGGNLDAWKAATAQIRADLPYPEEPK
jgi:hypothetical protein